MTWWTPTSSLLDALQGLLRKTIQDFFHAFAGRAVTTGDLLCHLAHTLAGCSLDSSKLTQSRTSSNCFIHDATNSLAHLSDTLTIAPDIDGCAEHLVTPWLSRLYAWLQEPGVPVVELRHSEAATGGPRQLQAHLLPPHIPGQV